MKILIIGGYGTFGGRLAVLLNDVASITLMIAGRSLEQAQDFCQSLQNGSSIKVAQVFERNTDLAGLVAQIQAIQPDLVVDATGPFQVYGDAPYRLIEACIECSVNYMDLSDGSDFVDGVTQFDEAARRKNIYVLSGVSSFPVLTAAVVRHLSHDNVNVTHITAGIAPSPYAGVGLNVIRAIASYSGQPLNVWRDGQPLQSYGLTETMRYTIAPPARLPLNNLHFSLVDVPDLKALPKIWPQAHSIWMGAGPVPAVLHYCLNGLAHLVKWRIVPSLTPLAPLFSWVMNHIRWGEHRGGMFVEIQGIQNNQLIKRSWHLLAEGNDGPFIPSMAIESLVRKILAGGSIPVGARSAVFELELADYAELFQNKTIFTGRRDDSVTGQHVSLFQALLGDAFNTLPAPLQNLHNQTQGSFKWQGQARVTRGTGFLSGLIARVIGFPEAADGVPVNVSFTVDNNGETWQRTFGTRVFKSVLSLGQGRSSRLLNERFGLFNFGIALVKDGERLRYIVRHSHFLGIPIPFPTWLAPSTNTVEYVDELGRFCFDVKIEHRLAGLIVHYQGYLLESCT